MHVLVADDKKDSCSYLCQMLGHIPDVEVVGEVYDGLEVINKTNQLHPDIVLMNIDMPGLDGLSAARTLSKITTPPAVIFIAANRSHSLDALDVHASGYLLKPVQFKRLKESVDYIRSTRTLSEQSVASKKSQHAFYCRFGNSLHLIDMLQVPYLRSSQKYTEIVGLDKRVLSPYPLSFFEKKYSDILVRARRNVLVNRYYIEGLCRNANNSYMVKLKNSNEKIMVSRRRSNEVRESLGNKWCD